LRFCAAAGHVLLLAEHHDGLTSTLSVCPTDPSSASSAHDASYKAALAMTVYFAAVLSGVD
jgi:hypothetical protein